MARRAKNSLRSKVRFAYPNPPGRSESFVKFEIKDSTAGSLLSRPDIATEIGFLIMSAACAESYLLDALTKMLRGKVLVARAIFGQIENLSAKVAIVYAIAEQQRGHLFCDKLLQTKEKFLEALSFRNLLAHGQYVFGLEDNSVSVISGLISVTRSDVKQVDLTPEIIREHVAAVRAVFDVVRQEFGPALIGFPIEMRPASPETLSQANPPDKRRKGQKSPLHCTPPQSSPE